MKNKYDLLKQAIATAEGLKGENSQKKIHDVASKKFDELKLNEADWNLFINYVHEAKAKIESLESQPLETTKLAQKAAEKAAPADAKK